LAREVDRLFGGIRAADRHGAFVRKNLAAVAAAAAEVADPLAAHELGGEPIELEVVESEGRRDTHGQNLPVASGHPAEEVSQRAADVVSDIHGRKAPDMEEFL